MAKYGSLIILVLLLACNDNNNNRPEKVSEDFKAEDTAAMAEPDNTEVLRMMIPGVFEYFSRQDSSFIPGNFIMSEKTPLPSMPAAPLEENVSSFYPYFIYNQDSTQAIDLFSANYVLQQRGGKKELRPGGPDTEAALLDLKNKTRKRLLFNGPAAPVLDAKWLNKNEILIAGAEEMGHRQIQPLMWRINIPDSTIQLYRYADTLQGNAYPYLEQKLKPAPSLENI